MSQARAILLATLLAVTPAHSASLNGALSCAARLMGEPVPRGQVMHLSGPSTIPGTNAATASTPTLWIVSGPRDMAWSTQVHEACHRVQYVREGGYNAHSRGPASERECEAIARRAPACRP